MKKLFSKLFVVGLLGGIFFMSGCGGDDDTEPTPPALSVALSAADADDIYDPGETIELTISFSSEAGLSGISYYYTIDGTDGQPQVINLNDPALAGLNLNEDSFTFNLDIDNSLANTSSSVTVTVIDQSLNEADETYRFVVNDASPISVYQTVLLGAQGNANEGFYNAFDGERYTYAEARDASTVTESPVDFAYYWGANDNSTIASIDDGGLNAVYNSVGLPIDGVFGTRNSTRFLASGTTAAEFDAIDNETELLAEASFDSTVGSSSMTELSENDVFAFVLDQDRGGYAGLVKIVSVDDTNGNGTITIEVKVQQ